MYYVGFSDNDGVKLVFGFIHNSEFSSILYVFHFILDSVLFVYIHDVRVRIPNDNRSQLSSNSFSVTNHLHVIWYVFMCVSV